jgi:hypothetical protein
MHDCIKLRLSFFYFCECDILELLSFAYRIWFLWGIALAYSFGEASYDEVVPEG